MITKVPKRSLEPILLYKSQKLTDFIRFDEPLHGGTI